MTDNTSISTPEGHVNSLMDMYPVVDDYVLEVSIGLS